MKRRLLILIMVLAWGIGLVSCGACELAKATERAKP